MTSSGRTACVILENVKLSTNKAKTKKGETKCLHIRVFLKGHLWQLSKTSNLTLCIPTNAYINESVKILAQWLIEFVRESKYNFDALPRVLLDA